MCILSQIIHFSKTHDFNEEKLTNFKNLVLKTFNFSFHCILSVNKTFGVSLHNKYSLIINDVQIEFFGKGIQITLHILQKVFPWSSYLATKTIIIHRSVEGDGANSPIYF